MASRFPTSKKPARPVSGTKRKPGKQRQPATSGEAAAPRLAYESLPPVAELKRARAKLDAALAALAGKRRK